ncbi:hypothetical protein Sta7437_0939 [Stanieria cyanosphaera PCC 7437]|uniref:Uncharacterized protein n=1 Tax=Stanieria cyanosphaera (strain ATCC 29371 / PCC 7437) TaxID=111780 RepID=K9XR27_STAC7|nr:hypothetical protein [Stanieria cyanosphaera]AFZ34521.1 hypothetical protein Sta7437_0939 [Stanieria cyanosphaera PCC 7437]
MKNNQHRQIHRANMLKSLEHRLQVAVANKDERLIRILERERQYYR